MEEFRYRLEEHLFALQGELSDGTYRHGSYDVFTVSDAKRRSIAVASVKDRLVHRLIYDYLYEIYDKIFVYDAWSCRKEKGLHKAIARAQHYLNRFHDGWFWRGDIQKFFDNVDHSVLLTLLQRRVQDERTIALLTEVIGSYHSATFSRKVVEGGRSIGIPIGNVTSQIFANIYLHEFDRFVKHDLKIRGYVRYGDDFVLLSHDKKQLESARNACIAFLSEHLRMPLHARNNIVLPCKRGLRFLGYQVFPKGRRLPKRTWNKLLRRLSLWNVASYRGLVRSEKNVRNAQRFDWEVIGLLDGSQ